MTGSEQMFLLGGTIAEWYTKPLQTTAWRWLWHVTRAHCPVAFFALFERSSLFFSLFKNVVVYSLTSFITYLHKIDIQEYWILNYAPHLIPSLKLLLSSNSQNRQKTVRTAKIKDKISKMNFFWKNIPIKKNRFFSFFSPPRLFWAKILLIYTQLWPFLGQKKYFSLLIPGIWGII